MIFFSEIILWVASYAVGIIVLFLAIAMVLYGLLTFAEAVMALGWNLGRRSSDKEPSEEHEHFTGWPD